MQEFISLARKLHSQEAAWKTILCDVLGLPRTSWSRIQSSFIKFNLATLAAYYIRRQIRWHRLECTFTTTDELVGLLAHNTVFQEFDETTTKAVRTLLEEWETGDVHFPYRVVYSRLKGYILVKAVGPDASSKEKGLYIMPFTYGTNLLLKADFPHGSHKHEKLLNFYN
jgi:hypothetical protein